MVYSDTFNPYLLEIAFLFLGPVLFVITLCSRPLNGLQPKIYQVKSSHQEQFHRLERKLQPDIFLSIPNKNHPLNIPPRQNRAPCYFSFSRIPVHPYLNTRNKGERGLVRYYLYVYTGSFFRNPCPSILIRSPS